MYEAMSAEGNDARMLSFPARSGNAHRDPENAYAWKVGCLGIVNSCSQTCEDSFLQCTNSGVSEFERCETLLKEGYIPECEVGCAPTLGMLKTSETPTVINLTHGKFGSQQGLGVTYTPKKPNCAFGSFDEVQTNKCTPKPEEGPAQGDIKSCSTGTCSDRKGRFTVTKPNGGTIMRTCKWAQRKSTAWRCQRFGGVKEACPKTCCNCSVDISANFKLRKNGRVRTCDWVGRLNKEKRCNRAPSAQVCGATCSLCESSI